jgi:hypothetical protein
MSLLRRRHFIQRAGGALAAMCALPEVSHAAPWPSRPVRLIVVYPPGGVSDGMARVLAEPLAQSLGVPVLIENRPGAGGSLAQRPTAAHWPSPPSARSRCTRCWRACPTTRSAPSCPWPA